MVRVDKKINTVHTLASVLEDDKDSGRQRNEIRVKTIGIAGRYEYVGVDCRIK